MTKQEILKDLEWRRNDALETAKFWEKKHAELLDEIESIKNQVKDYEGLEYSEERHKKLVSLKTRLNDIEKNEEENLRLERFRAMIVFDTIDRIVNSYKE